MLVYLSCNSVRRYLFWRQCYLSSVIVLVSLPLEFGIRRLSDVGSVVKLQYCFFGWHVDAYARVCITVFWAVSILLGDVGLVVWFSLWVREVPGSTPGRPRQYFFIFYPEISPDPTQETNPLAHTLFFLRSYFPSLLAKHVITRTLMIHILAFRNLL